MTASVRRAYRTGVIAALLATALNSCVLTQAEVGPEGSLDVFSLGSLGPKRTLPDDWVIESDGSRDVRRNIDIDTASGAATLTLKTGTHRFIMARRTKATLLASPYIGWSWRMAAQSGRESDIRLIVGFHGGNPESRSWGSEPLARLGTSLPPFDRIIAILWGQSALERGSFSTASTIPEYVARGGPEHFEKWWTDNLDLSELYRKAWPNDRFERVRIMFVGFAVSADAGSEAQFGDIVLYR
jgi:hypothetical protein